MQRMAIFISGGDLTQGLLPSMLLQNNAVHPIAVGFVDANLETLSSLELELGGHHNLHFRSFCPSSVGQRPRPSSIE